mmetsp:Transcript_105706/g.309175  ORF Transcript_105706/g.309175 Transcript_105706/m.309175 type:complete len:295 (-) Transcript_105706:184-1068(-)
MAMQFRRSPVILRHVLIPATRTAAQTFLARSARLKPLKRKVSSASALKSVSSADRAFATTLQKEERKRRGMYLFAMSTMEQAFRTSGIRMRQSISWLRQLCHQRAFNFVQSSARCSPLLPESPRHIACSTLYLAMRSATSSPVLCRADVPASVSFVASVSSFISTWAVTRKPLASSGHPMSKARTSTQASNNSLNRTGHFSPASNFLSASEISCSSLGFRLSNSASFHSASSAFLTSFFSFLSSVLSSLVSSFVPSFLSYFFPNDLPDFSFNTSVRDFTFKMAGVCDSSLARKV